MTKDTQKVQRWVQEFQSCCRYIIWEQEQGNVGTYLHPICHHENNSEEGKCVYRFCPFLQG